MNNDYWYIENDEQLGPIKAKDLAKKKLSDKTMVWYHGLPDWVEYGEIKDEIEVPETLTHETIENSKTKSRRMLSVVLIVFVLISISVGGILAYNRFYFGEDEAIETVEYFINMTKMRKVDNSIYPSSKKMKECIVLDGDYKLASVHKDAAKNYVVFVDYFHTKHEKYSISFVLAKKDGKVQIISSRGLSVFLYNGVYDFGVALRKLSGSESDVEISEKIESMQIESSFEDRVSLKSITLRFMIDASVNITYSRFGHVTGSVDLKNSSNLYLDNSIISIKVNFLDSKGNVLGSENIRFLYGIQPKSTSTSKFFASGIDENWSKYNVSFEIIESEKLTKLIKQDIIESAKKGNYNDL